ncbi:response regulator [Pseudoalteromonas piscicida]|uniref:Response regulator n=1 Tax=Pseudoalteromonas piscicida TaxID=43662 RepID=A0AAQ2EX81_PSEO7|nr:MULTISPECIES: response regulator [Pseudoalteromonas]KJY89874.1 histidine kinase [Pseudoalteromonas piscicida]MDP4488154.1 response regulator [Pseudoalteromonas piscicida]TMN38342.1 response regulator [Pseudoalteromonas piscicida]TMN40316.1 response regulator [Pseudoalteromonas piscicida]TMN55720.1 response regulator [Pseudoalteromonas piscicida]
MGHHHDLIKQLHSVNYILVADDDFDDQELIRDAFEDNGVMEAKLQFVSDGVELIEKLNSTELLPSLIILDLNMPRKSGKDVLAEMRGAANLKHIPVIMFSTSDSEIDIKQCYLLGANSYMTKPSQYHELVDSMKSLLSFWLGTAKLVID